MEREDAKDLTLSVLVVVAMALVGCCIWLHCRVSRQADEIADLSRRLTALEPPPPEPSFTDKAADVYNRVKSAAVKGFEAAKEEYSK